MSFLRESMVRQAGITQQQQGGSSLQHSTINLFNDHDRSTWHLFQKQMEDDEDDEDDWLRYVVLLSLFLLRYVTFTFLLFLTFYVTLRLLSHVELLTHVCVPLACVFSFGLCVGLLFLCLSHPPIPSVCVLCVWLNCSCLCF